MPLLPSVPAGVMLELVLMVPSGIVANVEPSVRVIVYDILLAPNLIGIYY